MLNWCAQLKFIMCSTGHYWHAQWQSILGAQWEVMYSTGHYWCVQQESLLSAQQDIMCSTGHYWGAQWQVRCSMGSYVLNWTLLVC